MFKNISFNTVLLVLTYCFLGSPNFIFGQNTKNKDSTVKVITTEKQIEKPTEKNFVFVFKLDNRFSFAQEQLISIYGFRTGFRLFKKHEIGIALNWLGSKNVYNIKNMSTDNNSFGTLTNAEKLQGTFFYKYFGFFYEPILHKKNKWAINLPLQFGGGKAGVDITNRETGVFIDRKEASFLLFEPALTAEYKFSKYLGVGFGGGYRFAFSEQKIVKDNLTKPVFILKLKIYLADIFRDVFKRK